MANMRVVSRNAVKRATLTASSTAGALAIDNLKTNDKSRVFRANGLSATVKGTFATAETISCAHLTHCNLSPAATMRVRASNEPAASNLLSFTEQMDNAVYLKGGATVGSNLSIAPDGRSSAQTLYDTTGVAALHYQQRRNVPVLAATDYTLSVFLRAAGRNFAQVANSTDSASINVNLLSGTLSDPVGSAYLGSAIFPLPNGWFRVSLTFKTTAASNSHLSVFMGNASGVFNYVGDGVSGIALWGWQLELGLVATSYYPSTQTFTSRASIGTYIDIDGLVATAASGVARMEYQYPSLSAVAPRLLVETASTNYHTFSEQFDQGYGLAAGSLGGATPVRTVNYAIAPDGTLTADRFVFSSPSSALNYYSIAVRTITGMAIGLYCYSLWMKSNTNANQEVLIYGSADKYIATVTPEWRRFYVASSTATTTWSCVFGTRGGSLGLPYTGGQLEIDISVWGGQAEQGASAPSSYIKSINSTPPVRAADAYTSAAASRPLGYMDWWQSYASDTGFVSACPAPARELEDWTLAQAASAYFNGGGAHAFAYFAPTPCLAFMINIVDPSNRQGYVEAAAALVVGDYWEPEYNATGATMTPVDSTVLYRNAAGGQMADAGTIHRTLPIEMGYLEAADRTKLASLLMNSRASPILVDLLPGTADASLRRDSMIYGRRPKDSEIALKYAGAYGSSIEVEEI